MAPRRAPGLLLSEQLGPFDENVVFQAGDEDVMEDEDPATGVDDFDETDLPELSNDQGTLTTKEELEIERRLSRLHRNQGHVSARAVFKFLKNSGASLQVLKLVRNFKCRACNSTVLPKAARAAAGVEIPAAFEVMGCNGLERTDPVDDVTYMMTLNFDEGGGLTQGPRDRGPTTTGPLASFGATQKGATARRSPRAGAVLAASRCSSRPARPTG